MSMYEKIGKFIGGVLAVTIAACAWLIIIAFTLKCLCGSLSSGFWGDLHDVW